MPSPYCEEHDHFRNTVRQFCMKELAPHADEWEKAELFPNDVFKRAGELGLFGAHYPEEHGGAGGDYWFSIAKAEELPRCGSAGVSMGLLVQSDMATPVISDLGTKEQIAESLTPAIRGEKIAALGVSEPNAGSDVAGIQTWAKQDGDDWIINGAKTYITNGTRADFVTLLVKTNPEAGAHGCSFFLVPTKTKGFSVTKKLKKIGNHASDTAELAFEEMRVPSRYMLGQPNQGFMYLMQNFQAERVWQHKFVDLATKLEAAKALTYKAAEMFNEERYVKKEPISFEAVKIISMAKIFVGELGTELIDQCLQFHGGAGYMEEMHIARAWRDQRLLRIGRHDRDDALTTVGGSRASAISYKR